MAQSVPEGWVPLVRLCVALRIPWYKGWRRVLEGDVEGELIGKRWYVSGAALQRALAERDRLNGDKRRLPRARDARGRYLPTHVTRKTAPAQAG